MHRRLAVSGLSSRRGGIAVLDHIDFNLDGGVLAVVGLNGSGKSTLLRTLAGVTPAVEGKIMIGERDITRLPAHVVAHCDIGYMQQNNQLFADLTVRENLRIGGFTLERKAHDSRLAEILDLMPSIRGLLERKAGVLSGGQRQLVALGAVLMRSPKIILLDEPSGGLSPIAATEIYGILGKLKQVGAAMVLAEQNLGPAIALADSVMVLYLGRVVQTLDARRLAADPGILHNLMLGKSTQSEASV
jgi:ABC-type branched-subunit amino acid transport system ATPase component